MTEIKLLIAAIIVGSFTTLGSVFFHDRDIINNCIEKGEYTQMFSGKTYSCEVRRNEQ